MRFILLCGVVLFPFLLSSCKSEINYIGETYSPTSSIDYFFSKDDIKKPYKTMGKALVSPGVFSSAQDMQNDLKEDARNQGADAIFVEDFRKIKTGESSYWNESGSATQKKKETDWNSSGSSNTQNQTDLELTVFYLKYLAPDKK